MDWLVHEPGMSVNNCVLSQIVEVLICACANSSQVVNIKVTVLLDALKPPRTFAKNYFLRRFKIQDRPFFY